jgi:hypothetical protein
MTVKAALDQKVRGENVYRAMQAIEKELRSIVGHKTFRPILFADIPISARASVSEMFMFIDAKSDRDKARLVYGANEYAELGEETHAPTILIITIMVMLTEAANRGHEIEIHDVPTAFLWPDADVEDVKLYGVIRKDVTDILVRLFPHFQEWVDEKGRLYVQLLKFIYGTKQAALKFFLYLKKFFIKHGFHQSVADRCLFLKFCEEFGRLEVATYVDDLPCTAETTAGMKWIHDILQAEWTTTFQQGDNLLLLGMSIVRNLADRTIKVSMPKVIDKLVKKFGAGVKPQKHPFTDAQMKAKTTSPLLTAPAQTEYKAIVMTLMFPMRYVRIDISFHTTYLSCYMSAPTDHHLFLAKQLVGYLMATPDRGITHGGVVNPGPTMIDLSADGSHAIHDNGRGHGMVIVTVWGKAVAWRSYKIPHVTLSSSETELSPASESVTWGIWAIQLCKDLGNAVTRPIQLEQDNQSAMEINEQGRASFKRSKHILVRHEFITEHIESGEVAQVWTPTSEIVSDIGTKPLDWPQLKYLLNKIGMDTD